MGELYKLDFPNGKSYIGITTKTARSRLQCHRNFSRGAYRADDSVLYKAWRKYGEPKMTVLAVLEDRELASTEIRAIAAYATLVPKGYNMTIGGDMSPMLNPEIAAKVSAAMKGKKRDDAFKAKRSELMKGNKQLLGFKHTQESKDKMAAKRKGFKHSEEFCKAASLRLSGVPKSKDHKAKMPSIARAWIAKMKQNDPARYQAIVDKRNEAIRASWAKRKEKQ